MSKNKILKQNWNVRTADKGENIKFFPIFEINEEALKNEVVNVSDKELECRYITVEVPVSGGTQTFKFNFLDLFMFIYHCANEELRQQLALRYERQVSYIPYEVTFKLSQHERQDGMAKRRINLTMDEVSIAYAKLLANKHLYKLAANGAPLRRK